MKEKKDQIIARNRKATHDFFIIERLEAGLVLEGTEVKSLRAGNANLKDGYVKIIKNEAYLFNCHISPYKYGGVENHDPERVRKLLLHRREIRKLKRQVETKGNAIIPLKLYFTPKGLAKLEIGVAKGKKKYDKRESIAAKESKREIDRMRKERF